MSIYNGGSIGIGESVTIRILTQHIDDLRRSNMIMRADVDLLLDTVRRLVDVVDALVPPPHAGATSYDRALAFRALPTGD